MLLLCMFYVSRHRPTFKMAGLYRQGEILRTFTDRLTYKRKILSSLFPNLRCTQFYPQVCFYKSTVTFFLLAFPSLSFAYVSRFIECLPARWMTLQPVWIVHQIKQKSIRFMFNMQALHIHAAASIKLYALKHA